VKPSQRRIYAGRIDKVVAHVAARLAEGVAPSLGELADIAGLSEYHFHRVFRLMTGETLSSTVQRLRLAISLSALSAPTAAVADATAIGAYATTQSYARALKARTGRAPTAARGRPAEIDRLQAELRRASPEVSGVGPAVGIEIVSFEPLTIVALRNVGDYSELNGGYARLFGLLPDVTAVTGLYGVPYDDPPETAAHLCRFDCCVSLGDPAGALGVAELRELHIAAGPCARLQQTGSYDQTWQNLDSLYGYLLDASEWSLGAAPPFVHYLDDPDVSPLEDLRAELYLPVVPARA
jgi:AraC family transcriptional regulator